jgi:hypothetical protein
MEQLSCEKGERIYRFRINHFGYTNQHIIDKFILNILY